ncbi:DUF917 family protein [Patescibacteria group bacterium]|nr:DUF917 family protein [Patescibacteria group bacterium]
MQKKLMSKDLNNIILGSSILSTGGGLRFSEQVKLIKQINKPIILENKPRVNHLALIPLEIGAANIPLITNKRLIKRLLKEINFTIQLKAIMPAEMGQESIAFLASSISSLPVLDMDLAGGRAAPRLPINIFSATGTPFVIKEITAINSQLQLQKISNIPNIFQAENILRKIAIQNQGSCFIGFIIKINHSFQKIITKERTLTKALLLGKNIGQDNFRKLNPKSITSGIINTVTLGNQSGFSQNIVEIISSNGKVFKIINENENLLLISESKILAQAPEIITLFDPKLKRGLHCSEFTERRKIKILISNPIESWQNKKAQKLWRKFALNQIN